MNRSVKRTFLYISLSFAKLEKNAWPLLTLERARGYVLLDHPLLIQIRPVGTRLGILGGFVQPKPYWNFPSLFYTSQLKSFPSFQPKSKHSIWQQQHKTFLFILLWPFRCRQSAVLLTLFVFAPRALSTVFFKKLQKSARKQKSQFKYVYHEPFLQKTFWCDRFSPIATFESVLEILRVVGFPRCSRGR